MKNFIKNACLAGLAVSVLVFTGCDLLSQEEDEPTATITLGTNASSVNAGDTLKVEGNAEASGKLVLTYSLATAAGVDVPSSQIKISIDASATPADEKVRDLRTEENLQLITYNAIGKTTCAGDYVLTIKAGADGELVDTTTLEFAVAGPACDDAFAITPDVTLKTDTLGAQSATPGSALDLDEFKDYTKSAAITDAAKIDLYLAHLTTSGTQIFSPDEAAAGWGLFPETDSWATTNVTMFYKTSLGSDFNNIVSQYQIDALWDESLATISRSTFSAGDVFIAKTNEGTIALMKVNAITTGTGATTEIEVSGYVAN
ncbi:hypothetical protein ACFL5V_07550 [Fibrobacterota bacterium]